jgi:hypothetical protein
VVLFSLLVYHTIPSVSVAVTTKQSPRLFILCSSYVSISFCKAFRFLTSDTIQALIRRLVVAVCFSSLNLRFLMGLLFVFPDKKYAGVFCFMPFHLSQSGRVLLRRWSHRMHQKTWRRHGGLGGCSFVCLSSTPNDLNGPMFFGFPSCGTDGTKLYYIEGAVGCLCWFALGLGWSTHRILCDLRIMNQILLCNSSTLSSFRATLVGVEKRRK